MVDDQTLSDDGDTPLTNPNADVLDSEEDALELDPDLLGDDPVLDGDPEDWN